MRYMGSKRQLVKYILPIILKNRTDNQYYVEPFCGGCNSLSEVKGNRIGSDNNYYLIQMWKNVSINGWIPDTHISEELYSSIKENKNEFPSLAGYIGFACSFKGQFFSGYVREKQKNRDMTNESYRNALIQFPKLKDVIFYHCDYRELPIPDKSIIYCDPPYKGTKEYICKNFNHEIFWEWVRKKHFDGHTIFVSEYTAPEDFKVIFEKKITKASKNTEKLFIYNG